MNQRDLVEQLLALGVEPGGVLLVHTAFSNVAPVDGGPRGLIEALQTVLGPSGTLVMPSMADDDNHVFDPMTSPCRSMGVVADTFFRLHGVLRSNSPHAFAAIGPEAPFITTPHPVDNPHGPNSPVGRVHDLDGQVLLLGVGHDGNTTVHLAESLAEVRYRLPTSALIQDGAEPRRIHYFEIDHCCGGFALLDDWLGPLQKRGLVGRGEARLARSRDIVRIAVDHLRRDETAFLHPPGFDAECDEARASIYGATS
ncbi:aminoglycoside N3-acetyltransferase [Minicystis rosea]|nr:aminoglycoside N3-acetyltransferase [Minicystis rosea]